MSHEQVAAFAARQAGCVSAKQADRCGFDDGRRRRMVRDGFWLRLHHGVDAVSGSVDSPERRLWAAYLALAPEAAVTHVASLWQWEMSPGRRFPGPQLVVPAMASGRRHGIVVHRASDFAAMRKPLRRGLPTTTPMRALVDAATVLPLAEVEESYDRGVGRKLISPPTVLAELGRLTTSRRNGIAAVRSIVLTPGMGSNRPPSYLEAKSRRLLKKAGLPDPLVEVVWGANGEYRLDFYWRDVRLAVEVHGWDFHSSAKVVARDFRRRNRISLTDVLVLDYTYSQIVYEPREVLKELSARLRPTLPGTGGGVRR